MYNFYISPRVWILHKTFRKTNLFSFLNFLKRPMLRYVKNSEEAPNVSFSKLLISKWPWKKNGGVKEIARSTYYQLRFGLRCVHGSIAFRNVFSQINAKYLEGFLYIIYNLNLYRIFYLTQRHDSLVVVRFPPSFNAQHITKAFETDSSIRYGKDIQLIIDYRHFKNNCPFVFSILYGLGNFQWESSR